MSDAALSRTAPAVVDYPTRDGRPVAETERHYDDLTYVAHALRWFFVARADAYVGSNLLVNYDPDDRRRHLSPDVFVAFGVPKSPPRDSYRLWEEKTPALVLEITSASTRTEDLVKKRRLYAQWGVREYFLYDPRRDYLQPPLQGLRLRDGRYRPIPATRLSNGMFGICSETLGLCFRLDGRKLRVCDPAAGKDFPTPAEEAALRVQEVARRQAAEDRYAEEVARRQAAEAENAELRALVGKLQEQQRSQERPE